MENYIEKIEVNLFELIKNINNLSILEFGVQNGESTIRFLDLCNQNNGYLYSVDIDDCSKVSDDKRWRFIKSRDDNFKFVKSIEFTKSQTCFELVCFKSKLISNLL